MRVAEGIHTLAGSRRTAVYDLRRYLCWPASEEELQVLQQLAAGRNPKVSTRLLVQLKNKGWIEAVVPTACSLVLNRPAAQKKPGRLEHVWLEVTNSCNLKCKHCYANSGPEVDRGDELTLEDWISVIRNVIDYGVRKLTFIGGEPTIRIDLVDELASFARSLDPAVQLRMFSNLAIGRVADRTLDVVEQHNIEFGTALYGIDAQTHDKMTQKRGSWATTVDAIDRCVLRKIDVFVGMYLEMTELDTLAVHERWLQQRGVTRFQVLAPSKVGRGRDSTWRKSPALNGLPGIFTFSEHHWAVAGSAHNCFFDHLAIMPNGKTSPCIMTRDVSYGNVLDGGVAALLDSDHYRQMSNLSKDNIPGCRECEFRYACFDCRPDAMGGTTNRLRKPSCGYDPRMLLGQELKDDGH
jgi:radical SAM protein with 4Fe4S-binding SPASM domain